MLGRKPRRSCPRSHGGARECIHPTGTGSGRFPGRAHQHQNLQRNICEDVRVRRQREPYRRDHRKVLGEEWQRALSSRHLLQEVGLRGDQEREKWPGVDLHHIVARGHGPLQRRGVYGDGAAFRREDPLARGAPHDRAVRRGAGLGGEFAAQGRGAQPRAPEGVQAVGWRQHHRQQPEGGPLAFLAVRASRLHRRRLTPALGLGAAASAGDFRHPEAP
mmetsp:Transcript_31398/g.91697  ORF Transcript_31398/g.91697 Transcript_31398/m.91697 type:complete len:218 (+) Transcript_31398:8-661(+)